MARAAALATGLLLGALLALPAVAAASPHVVSEVDTHRCAACHSVHRADDALLQVLSDVDAGAGGVCLNCHAGSDSTASNVVTGSVDSFNMQSGHSFEVETAGTAQIDDCATCHDIHGASSDIRRIPARVINGVAVSSAGKELCLACHNSDNSWYGPGYPSTAEPTRDAAGYPVLGTWPGPGTYASSANAHRLIPESTRTVGLSEPILREQGDCLYCHGSHGGANEYDGLVTTYTVPTSATLASDTADGSYAALCFSCHGGDRPAGFETTPVDIKQFATASGGSGGHSIVSTDAALPAGSPLPCFECHNAHGSQRGNLSQISDVRGGSLSTTSAAGVRAFCFTCHATGDTTAGWDSDANSYEPVTSAEKIVGVSRDGGVLALPDRDGHGESDTASCYSCHGDDYGPGGNNVHNPGDGSASLMGPFLPEDILSIDSTQTVGATSISSVEASETTGAAPFEMAPAIESTDAATVEISQTGEPTDASAFGSVQTVESAGTLTAIAPWISTDVIAPLTLSDAQSSYVGSATITLSAVDDTGGVGVADTYYTLDGSDVATGGVVVTTDPGDHTLTFWSVDRAGNAEGPVTVDFTVEGERAISAERVETIASRLGRWISDRGGT